MRRGVWILLAVLALLVAWVAISHLLNPLEPRQWAWVLGFLALVAALAWGQLRRPLVQYLFLCRFSLFAALFVAVFPLAALDSALFSNLFVMERPAGLAILTLLALLHAWVALVTMVLTVQLAPTRFRVVPFDPPLRLLRLLRSRWSFLLAALLAAPAAALAVVRTGLPPAQSLALVAAGTAAALLIVLAVVEVRRRLLPGATPSSLVLLEDRSPSPGADEEERPRGIQPFLDGLAERLCRWFSPTALEGYVYRDEQGRLRLYRGHLFSALALGATFLVYLASYKLQTPGRQAFDTLPALGYLFLLLTALTWLLTGAAFYLDRYRVPPLLLLGAISFFSFFVSDTDHYYDTFERAPDKLELTPAAAVDAWYGAHVRKDAEPPVLVAVTAVGGGITTAVWTDWVLARLGEEVGPDLIGSIALISGVSGGSVGALHFLDELTAGDLPLQERLDRAADLAAQPSLAEAVWGLVYPDLWRGIPGGWFRAKDADDRGEALELAWRRKLHRPRARLSDWRAGVAAGRIPAVVFNTTINETGGRLLLTPLDLPRSGGRSGDCRKIPQLCLTDWRAHNFFQLYPERDVEVATAARLSAAFPYVSPIPRPRLGSEDERAFHLADGGYYDNYGVTTLVDWLDDAQPVFAKRGGRKILVVQIRDVPDAERGGARRAGWTLSFAGPLRTLVRIRTASQANRNELDVEMMQRLACREHGLEIASVIFSLEPGGKKEQTLPLSWQLTADERRILEGRWSTPRNRAALACARAFFRGGDTAVCGAAVARCS